MDLPDKFGNLLLLGIGATVFFSVFILLLMGFSELLVLIWRAF